jgi:hypothetical protein
MSSWARWWRWAPSWSPIAAVARTRQCGGGGDLARRHDLSDETSIVSIYGVWCTCRAAW